MFRLFLSAVLIAVIPGLADAAEPNRVQRWLSELDHENFAVREKATSELIAANHEVALPAVAKAVEEGTPEASSRALLVLGMWHRSDSTSRAAVMATAKRWQGAKDLSAKRHGMQLAAMTAPKKLRPQVPNGIWAVGGAEGVIFLDGAAMAVPLRTR
ncbi:MAG: hypothetical protein MI757_04635 [Pirellulales bacterium]|nr:hypothetical protein [Pirellulales bacterium]